MPNWSLALAGVTNFVWKNEIYSKPYVLILAIPGFGSHVYVLMRSDEINRLMFELLLQLHSFRFFGQKIRQFGATNLTSMVNS